METKSVHDLDTDSASGTSSQMLAAHTRLVEKHVVHNKFMGIRNVRGKNHIIDNAMGRGGGGVDSSVHVS